MLKKITTTLSLLSLLVLNNSCYYMNYNFGGPDKLKEKEISSKIYHENYSIKLEDSKIDTKNNLFSGKVQFVPEYQEITKKIVNIPGEGGSAFFAQSIVKIPLFIGSAYFFGAEANKGNFNIPLAVTTSLFVLDFISWGILNYLEVPSNLDNKVKEEIVSREDLKLGKYENLESGKIKVTCNQLSYYLNTDEQSILKINHEEIKQFTKNNTFNQDCYINTISLKDKQELKIKDDLKLFSWLPSEYINLFTEYQKETEKVDLHIKSELLK